MKCFILISLVDVYKLLVKADLRKVILEARIAFLEGKQILEMSLIDNETTDPLKRMA